MSSHTQYIPNIDTGGAYPVITGPVTFKGQVEFEKGFDFHTDNVAADDPLGDSWHHLNQALGQVAARTFDASDGITIDGLTSVNSLVEPRTNIFGSMSWALKQLDPGDFTAGGMPNGYYNSFFDSDLVLLVNQTNVQINIGIAHPFAAIVTVKDITGLASASTPIRVYGPAGLVEGAAYYDIEDGYEHVVFYYNGSNTYMM